MELWQELNDLRRAEIVLGQLPVGVQLGVNEMTTSIGNHGSAMGILCRVILGFAGLSYAL